MKNRLGLLIYKIKNSLGFRYLFCGLLFPINILTILLYRPPLVLAYHRIYNSNTEVEELQDISISDSCIRKQLTLLSVFGYRFINNPKSIKRGRCLVTYDDGFIDTLKVLNSDCFLASVPSIHFISESMASGKYLNWAAQTRHGILRRPESKGYNFSEKGSLHTTDEFWSYRNNLLKKPANERLSDVRKINGGEPVTNFSDLYASFEQIRVQLAPDHLVSCHGRDHEAIWHYESREALLKSLVENKNALLCEFGGSYRNYHALPYGAEPDFPWKHDVLADIYEYVFLTRPYRLSSDSSFMVPRLCLSEADGILMFTLKCSGLTNLLRKVLNV